MSTAVPLSTTLRMEAFWAWLREHANCILRAGSADVELHDSDDLHWHLEGDFREPILELVQGKRILASMYLDTREVAFVQATPSDSTEDKSTLFELITTGRDGNYSPYHFLMAHPMDADPANAQGHSLKH